MLKSLSVYIPPSCTEISLIYAWTVIYYSWFNQHQLKCDFVNLLPLVLFSAYRTYACIYAYTNQRCVYVSPIQTSVVLRAANTNQWSFYVSPIHISVVYVSPIQNSVVLTCRQYKKVLCLRVANTKKCCVYVSPIQVSVVFTCRQYKKVLCLQYNTNQNELSLSASDTNQYIKRFLI
jgi:hypothetical protein